MKREIKKGNRVERRDNWREKKKENIHEKKKKEREVEQCGRR